MSEQSPLIPASPSLQSRQRNLFGHQNEDSLVLTDQRVVLRALWVQEKWSAKPSSYP